MTPARSSVAAVLLAVASAAHAQPAAPQPLAADRATGIRLRAGLGFSKYVESGAGFEFAADLQPFAQVGVDAATPAGRGTLVLQASAGAGSEVDMAATSQGEVFQRNKFSQELIEATPRIRWPISPGVLLDAGYRFTFQRLHILGVPGIGDAREDVMVHALEIGFVFARSSPGGGRREFDVGFGINRGYAENDRIDGEDFSAGGFSFQGRAYKQWASGFSLAGTLAVRKQNGSDVEQVRFDGMDVMAQWPDNTTWLLVLAGGVAFE